MVHEPQLIQVAAGIDFDSIAPFVFVFLIVASQIMGALKKKGARKEEEPDVDALERARQIREEIRRKIEERRQEMEPGTTRPVDRPRRSVYDPTRPDSQQQRAPQAQRQPTRLERPVTRPTSPARPVSWPAQPAQATHQPSLEEQLQEQRNRLEMSRLQQKEAQAKASRMLQESRARGRRKEEQAAATIAKSGAFKKQLLGGLRDKNGLRKAVLYREILGKPLGMR